MIKDIKRPADKSRIKVLLDHKKVGKRFIPPLLQVGPFSYTKWVDCVLPELLWLGVLNHCLGLAKGASSALSLAQAAVKTCKSSPKKIWFAPTSSYSNLTEEQKNILLSSLKSGKELESLKEAFVYFGVFYPDFPLNFIYEGNLPKLEDQNKHLRIFKDILSPLFYRAETEATFMQANAIYIALGTDMLKISKGLSLANFPAIEEYPNTDESRLIASGVRAMTNGFFGQLFPDMHTKWSKYFWNRGLELEGCDYIYEKE